FDAEDLTQEVFLSAYKKLSEFDRNYEKAWLGKIAVNKCLDFLKQAGRRTIPTNDTYFLELQSEDKSPEENYLVQESKQQVYHICQQLASPYNEIALEHYYYELSVQDIAAKTGKNIKTLQTQLYRSKAMIKKILERSG
ncbi:RNA polymerase subunit sigma-70, partial [Lachnotalea glycerini]